MLSFLVRRMTVTLLFTWMPPATQARPYDTPRYKIQRRHNRALFQASQRITITEGPGQKDLVNRDDFPIVFEVPGDVPTECLLSKGPETILDWFVCTSPLNLPEATRSEGEYTLRIRIRADPATASRTEAVVTFTVDLTKPETSMVSYSNRTSSNAFTFEFESMDEDVDYFQCDLDHSGIWQRCRSPKTYPELIYGHHVFSVRAVDLAGNVDDTPATQLFRVDHPSRKELPDYEPTPASVRSPSSIQAPSTSPTPSPSPSPSPEPTPSSEDTNITSASDTSQESNASTDLPESAREDIKVISERHPSPTVVEKTNPESLATVIVYVVVSILALSIVVVLFYLSRSSSFCSGCSGDVVCCPRVTERTNT